MKLRFPVLYWKRRYIPLQKKDAAIFCIGNPKNFHCSQTPKMNFGCNYTFPVVFHRKNALNYWNTN